MRNSINISPCAEPVRRDTLFTLVKISIPATSGEFSPVLLIGITIIFYDKSDLYQSYNRSNPLTICTYPTPPSRTGCDTQFLSEVQVVWIQSFTSPRLVKVVVKVLEFAIKVSEFELQSHNYVHFRTNALGKGIDPPILPSNRLFSEFETHWVPLISDFVLQLSKA